MKWEKEDIRFLQDEEIRIIEERKQRITVILKKKIIESPIYKEHNSTYLRECIENLQKRYKIRTIKVLVVYTTTTHCPQRGATSQ